MTRWWEVSFTSSHSDRNFKMCRVFVIRGGYTEKSILHLSEILGLKFHDAVFMEFLNLLGSSHISGFNEVMESISFKEKGIDIILKIDTSMKLEDKRENNYIVNAIHVYAEGQEEHHQYLGLLVGGVTFDDNRNIVQEKLGKPFKSGGGNYNIILKKTIENWDRYNFNECAVAFTYSNNGKIKIVTIMPASYP